jgi:hypothetical protein
MMRGRRDPLPPSPDPSTIDNIKAYFCGLAYLENIEK